MRRVSCHRALAAAACLVTIGGCAPPPRDDTAARRIADLEKEIAHLRQEQATLSESVSRLQAWVRQADEAAAAYEAELAESMAGADTEPAPDAAPDEPIVILEELPPIDPESVATGVYLCELLRTDGTVAERGELVLSEEGTLIRHGRLERFSRDGQRLLYHLVFDHGLLTDQQLIMRQDNGVALVEGRIRGSAAEGEWVWFDDAGEPAAREQFRAGRLRELQLRGEDGAWMPAGETDLDNWLVVSRTYFRAIPELRRPGN